MNPRLFDADCDLRLKYAGVYVLGNPYCVDGLYDYEIPCEMGNGAVVPGSFVTVPFGHPATRRAWHWLRRFARPRNTKS